MKIACFHLMPYRDLDDDFEEISVIMVLIAVQQVAIVKRYLNILIGLWMNSLAPNRVLMGRH